MNKKKLNTANKFKLSGVSTVDAVIIPLICILLIVVPFYRGLYFRENYLPTIALLGIIFILHVITKVVKKNYNFFNSYLDFLVFLLPVAYVISFAFSVNMKNAFDVILKYVSYYMIYKIISDRCGDKSKAKYIVSAVVLSAYIVSITGLLAMAGLIKINGAIIDNRIYGLYQYPNATASAIGAGILITVGVMIQETRVLPVLFYQVLLSTMLAGFIFTMSLGGLLVLAVLLIIFYFVTEYEYKVNFVISLIIAAVSNIMVFLDYFRNLLKTNFIGYYLISIVIAVCLQFLYIKVRQRFLQNIRRSSAIIISACIVIVTALTGVIGLSSVGLLKLSSLEKLWSTQLKMQNALDRIIFTKDGLRIFADNFLVGTGGGAWADIYQQYQSFAYTSREAHNFYIQVMTETGIIGTIVLAGIIIYILRNFIIDFKNRNRSLLPIYMGIFMVLGHALLDFDLSYAALSFSLWTLIGLISRNESMQLAENVNKSNYLKYSFVAVGLLTMFFSTANYMGMGYGNKASGIVKSNLNKAIPIYEKAMKFDRYNAAYRMDYAQIMAEKYKAEKDSTSYDKLLGSLNEIERYEPNNGKYMAVRIGLYLSNGMFDEGVELADRLITLQPLAVSAYLNKLNVNYEIAKYYFSLSQHDKALPYLDKMIETEQQLETAKSRSLRPLEVPENINGMISLAKNWKMNAERIIESKTK